MNTDYQAAVEPNDKPPFQRICEMME